MTDSIQTGDTTVAGAKPARRRFLRAAVGGVAGAAAMTAPMVSVAQSPIVIKMQGAWGAKDIFNEMAEEYVKRVNEMAGRPPAHRLPDRRRRREAVRGHGCDEQGRARRRRTACPCTGTARSKVASLFGSGPINGCDAHQTLAWIYRGGGLALYNELLQKINLDVVGFFAMPMPTQPLGWFKKPINGRGRPEGPEVPHRGPGRGPVPADGHRR